MTDTTNTSHSIRRIAALAALPIIAATSFWAGTSHTGTPTQRSTSPSCWVESSATHEGFEVIYYPQAATHHSGFEVPCPAK